MEKLQSILKDSKASKDKSIAICCIKEEDSVLSKTVKEKTSGLRKLYHKSKSKTVDNCKSVTCKNLSSFRPQTSKRHALKTFMNFSPLPSQDLLNKIDLFISPYHKQGDLQGYK